MALIVTHLQDKKSVYLQDRAGNEAEFIRVDVLRKLVADMRDDKDYGRHWGTSMHWADRIEKLLNGGE